MKKIILSLVIICCAFTGVYSQIVGESGYLIGDYIEIGISFNGHEGAASIDGDHARFEGGDDSELGIVANPLMDGWVEYNGDYFLPGFPQNGFGLEIDGENYNNTRANITPDIPGEIISYTEDENCMILEWEGEIVGVIMNVKYRLIKDALFYSTEITLTNTNPVALSNVYYLRTIEPDNNFELIGAPLGYNTINTTVSQSGLFCNKTLITAEQTTPWDSYIGFCGIGNNYRSARGGFVVNDASDVWDAAGFFAGDVGTSGSVDQAISLAYKISALGAGETEIFEYATVLTEASVADAITNLYEITYDAGEGVGTGACNHLADTVRINCEEGNTVALTIEGPDVDSYNWSWTPAIYLDVATGETVISTPLDTVVYTVTGTPVADCLDNLITKTIVVIPTGIGPSISVVDPGPQCDEFDLTTLEFEDENDIPLTVTRFFTEIPISADQTEPLFEEDIMTADDVVYLMIGDTIEGCFDWIEIDIDFAFSVHAGADSTITVCADSGVLVDLNNLISDDADLGGELIENSFSDQFDEETGELELTDLSGTYAFAYILEAEEPCLNDTASFEVIVNSLPIVTISDDVTIASGETTILTASGGTMYSWFPTTGLSDPLSETTDANPTETTTYTVTITDENGCINNTEVTVTIDGQVSIAELKVDLITVFPNPFTDYTTIQFNTALNEPFHIVIYDMLGQKVYQKENINTSEVEIGKADLGKGIYMLTILNAETNQTQFVTKLIAK